MVDTGCAPGRMVLSVSVNAIITANDLFILHLHCNKVGRIVTIHSDSAGWTRVGFQHQSVEPVPGGSIPGGSPSAACSRRRGLPSVHGVAGSHILSPSGRATDGWGAVEYLHTYKEQSEAEILQISPDYPLDFR